MRAPQVGLAILCSGLLLLAVLASADELDITRKGKFVVSDPGGALYSEHNELHVAFERAAECSRENGGAVCGVEPLRYEVTQTPSADGPVAPAPDPNPPAPLPIDDDARLTWEAPTSRENGTALTLNELCCYVIDHTRPDGSMVVVNVSNAITLEHNFDGLALGTHSWTVRALDTDGRTSDPSNRVTFEVIDPNQPDSCSATVPDSVTVEYLPSGIQFSWGAKDCGVIRVEQCLEPNQLAGRNCWDGGQPVAELDAKLGTELVPYGELDMTNVGGAGSHPDCGFRLRHWNGQTQSAVSSSGGHWGGDRCVE